MTVPGETCRVTFHRPTVAVTLEMAAPTIPPADLDRMAREIAKAVDDDLTWKLFMYDRAERALRELDAALNRKETPMVSSYAEYTKNHTPKVDVLTAKAPPPPKTFVLHLDAEQAAVLTKFIASGGAWPDTVQRACGELTHAHVLNAIHTALARAQGDL